MFVANLFSYAITNFCVIITQVVQNFTIRGKIQPIQMPTFVSQLPMSQFKLITPEENINGTTLPISQLEQGVALCHWSTSIFILFVTTFILATLKGSIKIHSLTFDQVKNINWISGSHTPPSYLCLFLCHYLNNVKHISPFLNKAEYQIYLHCAGIWHRCRHLDCVNTCFYTRYQITMYILI